MSDCISPSGKRRPLCVFRAGRVLIQGLCHHWKAEEGRAGEPLPPTSAKVREGQEQPNTVRPVQQSPWKQILRGHQNTHVLGFSGEIEPIGDIHPFGD